MYLWLRRGARETRRACSSCALLSTSTQRFSVWVELPSRCGIVLPLAVQIHQHARQVKPKELLDVFTDASFLGSNQGPTPSVERQREALVRNI